jgi:hypothetical protein
MIHRTVRTLSHGLVACVVLVCLAVMPGAQTLDAQANNWKTYSYPADGFSASYPSEPELQKTDIPTKTGSFELRSYMAQVAGVALFVGVCDYGIWDHCLRFRS